MDFVRVELPSDAVARVNPDFIRKKRQSLTSFVVSLSSHGSLPLRPAPPEEQSKQQATTSNARGLKTKSIGKSESSFFFQTFRAAWILS